MLQKKLVNFLLTLVVLVYIVFEELIWERFATPIIRYFNSLKILSKLEEILQKFPSWVIMILFLLMFVPVELLGVYAGKLFLEGKFIHGTLIYAGKIPIAAFTFWLFRVSKEKLLEFRWFEKSYLWIMNIIEKIKSSEIYHNIKAKSTAIKVYVKTRFFQDKSTVKKKIQVIYRRLKALLKM